MLDNLENNLTKTPLFSAPPGSKNIFSEGIDPSKVGGGNPNFVKARLGRNIISVKPGESIQKAINLVNENGGGRVFLQNGIHYPKGNLTLYSGVYLEGETVADTIIDFESESYSVLIQGSDTYSTGTVSINAGSTTVTGALTVWTSAMEGQFILLDGDFYPIASVTSETELELDYDFSGENLAGASYVIATTIDDVQFSYLTIQNSATNLVEVAYANYVVFNHIDLNTGVIGINVNTAISFGFYDGNIGEFTNGFYLTDCFSYTLQTFYVYNCTGTGIVFINGGDSTVYNFGISACNIGLQMTGVSKLIFISFTIDSHTSHGVEFVSTSDDNAFMGGVITDNGGEGIKLTATSDTNIIQSVQIRDNSLYGINIAAATCDNNLILGNIFSNNTSGNSNNSGTGTLIRSNIGVSDSV